MTGKLFRQDTLYHEGAKFFELKGDSCMALSPHAAREICEEATLKGFFVGTVEGGHRHNPGFQPDSNTRWDSLRYYQADADLKANNDRAIENINDDASEGYTAFLITLIKSL